MAAGPRTDPDERRANGGSGEERESIVSYVMYIGVGRLFHHPYYSRSFEIRRWGFLGIEQVTARTEKV